MRLSAGLPSRTFGRVRGEEYTGEARHNIRRGRSRHRLIDEELVIVRRSPYDHSFSFSLLLFLFILTERATGTKENKSRGRER